MAKRAQRSRIADYHQLTIGVPPETDRLLDAAAFALNRPRWRLMVAAGPAFDHVNVPLAPIDVHFATFFPSVNTSTRPVAAADAPCRRSGDSLFRAAAR